MASTDSDDQIYCYILKTTTQGEKDVRAGLQTNDGGYHKILSLMGIERTNVQIARGEFVQLMSSPHAQMQRFQLFRDATITFSCPPSDVGGLNYQEYNYLGRSEPAPERRYNLYMYTTKEQRTEGSKPRGPASKKPASLPTIGASSDSHRECLTSSSLPVSPVKTFTVPPKIGSTVMIPSYGNQGSCYYGIIRWLGLMPNVEDLMAGIELEEDVEGCSDGTSPTANVRYFHCPPRRGLYYSFESLQPDDRQRTTDSQSESSITSVQASQAHEDDSFAKDKEKALHRQLMSEETKKASEQHEPEKQKASVDKKVKSIEEAEIKPKEKKIQDEDDDPSPREDTSILREQVKQLSLRLELERRRIQQLEMQLAFERKKVLDLKKESEKVCSPVESPTQPNRPALLQGQSVLDWKIKRQDLRRVRTIGSGAWGLVYEGWYKGHAVAIKEPHLAIMSNDTNSRMEREINIMALTQHPNLVRFVGAVMDDDARLLKLPPLIVTELLDTDLRSAYKKHNLEHSRLQIFRDVAYALHYLHEHQEPIIHRDVSAPNVLLETLPNETWRAKVTDFGSANIAKYSKTVGEGAIIYSAPETFPSPDPRKPMAKQTTKIDTFSFGILVCEVITCKQPRPETRLTIIQDVRVKWPAMHNLVIECTKEKPEMRPTMSDILKKLHSITVPRLGRV